MKMKGNFNYLIGFWIVFIALDSINGLFRLIYLRKMNRAIRFFCRSILLSRNIVIFMLVVFNYLMIAEHSKIRQS